MYSKIIRNKHFWVLPHFWPITDDCLGIVKYDDLGYLCQRKQFVVVIIVYNQKIAKMFVANLLPKYDVMT